ncbi:hypothetical protein [Candidatus Methylacidiphilum fumarolicum]|nr:hypothetical protein [Candidatus Methylacidiphilum fumarolicum]
MIVRRFSNGMKVENLSSNSKAMVLIDFPIAPLWFSHAGKL